MFSVVELTSANAFATPGDYRVPFTPDLEGVYVFRNGKSDDKELLINRYKNSVHYLDSLFNDIAETLGSAKGSEFSDAYDVTEAGNWEGKTILNRLHVAPGTGDDQENALAEERDRLLEVRASAWIIRPFQSARTLSSRPGIRSSS